MTTAHKATIVGVIVLTLLLVIGSVTATYLVMSEKMATAVTSAHSDERKSQIDALNASITKRDQEFADYKSQAEKRTAQVKTVPQVAAAVQKPVELGGLTFNPFRVYTQTTPAGKTEQVVDVPQENIVPLYAQLRACNLREIELGKCNSDKTELLKSNVLVTKDRDDWKETAKGGSKLKRVWSFTWKAAIVGVTAYELGRRSPK
jgi:hypothetical protein